MAAPLKYRVTWTVCSVDKPSSARCVTMTVEIPGLAESLALARDLYLRHSTAGDQLDVQVVTPAGNTFVDLHLDATPF